MPTVSSYLMPIIWPATFPKPMKIEPVSVRKPLSFFGELSPRYMRCTLRPRPLERNTKSLTNAWKNNNNNNKKKTLIRTYRHYTHREIFPVGSSQTIWPCDWRAWEEQRQSPQRCWSIELFSCKIQRNVFIRWGLLNFTLHMINLWAHSNVLGNWHFMFYPVYVNMQ